MKRIIAAGLAAAGLLLAGCGSVTAPGAGGPAAVKAAGSQAPRELTDTTPAGPPGAQAIGSLRLGTGPELADAAALVGEQTGFFAHDLGDVTLEFRHYSSDAQEVTALEDGQLDAAYLDPVSALQARQSAPGGLVKIVAGAASGGAELVVSPGITGPAQLKGQRLAASMGGTEQAAAYDWLHQLGLPVPSSDGASASTAAGLLHDFRAGTVAGGWEPAPLDVEMAQAGGKVLVNESSLWAGGNFPTAVLVVTKTFLTGNPAAVTGLLQGHVEAEAFLTGDPSSAAAVVAQQLAATSDGLSSDVITQSFAQLTFTNDPLSASLYTEAQHAATAGLTKTASSLANFYDLTPLNQVLQSTGQQPVDT